MTRVLATLDLPLEKAIAPARFRRPISVISSPLRPLVIAAIVCTLTMALSRARRWMKSTSATWSMTGLVSGITTMVVTPPAAAAWLAVFKVSRCSLPGSPVNTCASIEAGGEHVALAVDDLGALGRVATQVRAEIGDHAIRDQQAARLVAVRCRVDQARVDEDGAAGVLRPVGGFPRCCGVHRLGRFAGQRFEHGHAHGNAHLHLVADDAREWSATVEAISTPRFMGPGCMTRASGLARASFS